MNITTKNYHPVSTFLDELMNRNISELIGSDNFKHMPSANIIEKEKEFVVALAAPGFNKEQFNIVLDKNLLTISVKKVALKDENAIENNVSYNRKEFDFSDFSRSFKLPKEADNDSIKATYTNGILNIQIAKKKEALAVAPKNIEIH